jgi:hypothetical protein
MKTFSAGSFGHPHTEREQHLRRHRVPDQLLRAAHDV